MRRLFVVLILWVMMIGLRTLTVQDHSTTATLTLAATGFVVLAAFAVAEMGGKFSLPKVTGYILCGIAFGPGALQVLTDTEVENLKMFGDLALGLIAMTAGLEIDLRGLARLAKTLAVTIAVKVVVGIVLVGGALVAVAAATGALGSFDQAELTSLGLVFGALSIGTSPAIALAVASETKASGRLTSLVLGAAAVKDVVVVVCLSVALAVSAALRSGGQLDVVAFKQLAVHLCLSLAIGSIIGGLLIAWLRFVHREMLLVVVVIVLMGDVLADDYVGLISEWLNIEHGWIHLEKLLMFIVAGAWVRNASPYEHELLHPLETISLPVFVVFFTNAGANIDLAATIRLLPIALLLGGVRAAVYYLASRVGGYFGGESEDVQDNAWLAYLPQAGVTLGLATDIAFNQLGGSGAPLAEMVKNLGIAAVAVNLLVGPITLRLGLDKVGEIPRPKGEGGDAAADTPDDPCVEEPRGLESARLRNAVDELSVVLTESWAAWRRNYAEDELKQWRAALRSECSDERSQATSEVARRLERLPLAEEDERVEDLRNILGRQAAKVESLADEVVVPLETHHRVPQPDDGFIARWSKRLATVAATLVGQRKTRTRSVPLRITARTFVEPAMSQVAEESIRDLQRFEVVCLEIMQRVALGTISWSDGQGELDTLLAETKDKLADNHKAAVKRVRRELIVELGRQGAPTQWRRPRYSGVFASISETMQRVGTDARKWVEHRSAAVRTLRFVTEVELAGQQLADNLQRDVATPLDETFEKLHRLVEEQRARIEALPRAEELTEEDAWERLDARVRALLPKPSQRELRAAGARARRATSGSAALGSVMSFVTDGDAKIRIVPSLHDMARAPRPASIEPVLIDVRELKEVQISGQLLPDLEQLLEQVNEALVSIRESMREAASLVEFGFSAAQTGRAEGKDDAHRKYDESLERASAVLEGLATGPCTTWHKLRPHLLDKAHHMPDQLIRALRAAGTGRVTQGASTSMSKLQSRAGVFARTLRTRLVRAAELVRAGDASQAADDLARRYRWRTGDERVDAQAIRHFLDEQRKARKSAISGLYASLFTPEPLRDPRLFVAHRDALSNVVRAARSWQSESTHGNGALVIGGSGSGKSSTLSIAQLKLGARRVLILRRGPTEGRTIRDALARTLGCEATDEAVLKSLRGQRSVVVVDDLHQWLAPTADGLADLRRLQQLMASTLETTFFLASLSTYAYEVWHRTAAIEQSFACSVRLHPIDAEQLEVVVNARHELSGMPLEFPRTWGSQAAERVLNRSARMSYIRGLATASRGNLRRALTMWVAHAEPINASIRLHNLTTLGWSLPFVHQLGPQAMAVLATLLRHGPQAESTLAESMGAAQEEVAQLGRFLVATGLVERQADTHRLLLTSSFIDDLVQALGEHGVVGGSS